MRIVSRLNEDTAQHDRLKEILEAATDGNITPGNTLEELVTQVDDTIVSYMEQVDQLEEDYQALRHEVDTLSVQVTLQEKMLESITGGIQFDEALDYATLDLMDALLGSGTADSTFDGDISFEDGVVFTKEDLKPILRQALDTWITLKTS